MSASSDPATTNQTSHELHELFRVAKINLQSQAGIARKPASAGQFCKSTNATSNNNWKLGLTLAGYQLLFVFCSDTGDGSKMLQLDRRLGAPGGYEPMRTHSHGLEMQTRVQIP